MLFRSKKILVTAAAACAVLICVLQERPAAAQQTKARRGPNLPDAYVAGEHAGFQSIFDGTTLNGWDGDPDHWRAEGGMIVGETTTEKPLKINTFLIWRGGKPKDFELKAEYRINNTNSGIQYRSVELPDVGKWVMKGYQADIDAANQYTGQNYEERGRGFLCLRGQFTHVADGQKPVVVGTLTDDQMLQVPSQLGADPLKAFIKNGDWNQFHIIARGNMLIHVLNGHVMSMVIDDDSKNRMMEGELGLQLHMGPPMKLEVRNIWLKNL